MVRDHFCFVFDYLKKVGLETDYIIEAIADENLEKSYALIISNPSITKVEFCKQMGIDYDEDFARFNNFLNSLQMPFPYKAEIFLNKNFSRALELSQTNPDISKEEFIEMLQLTGVFRGYNDTVTELDNYLTKLGVKKRFIEEALEWENYPTMISLYKQNPSFTKEEFMSWMGFVDKK